MQTGNITHEVVEAVAGSSSCGIHVDAVEALHNVRMIGNLILGHERFTEALDFHIGAVVRSDGNGGIDDIRDEQHPLIDLSGIFLFLLFQSLKFLFIGFHSSHIGINLGLDRGFFLFRSLF